MPPTSAFVIAVAGAGSSCGKTTLACDLVHHLSQSRRVGALKIATATADHRCARSGLPCSCLEFEGPSRLTREPAAGERAGKDTWRMRQAGADPVWFLQTTVDFAAEVAGRVVGELRDPGVWVVEGAAPIRAGLADLAVVIAPGDGREPKPGWFDLVPRADVLLFATWNGDAGVAELTERCRAAGLRPETAIERLAGSAGTGPPIALLRLVEAALAVVPPGYERGT